MGTYPLNLTGGTYKHRSLPLSAQRTINFWPQKQTDEKAKSSYILECPPGYLLFGTQAGGADRGMLAHKDILYKVSGTVLYTVSSSGVHTSRGTIPGSGRCILAPIGSYIIIANGTARYLWNGSAVSLISDSDLEAGDGVAVLNNQALYDGTGNRFGVSDAGDATSINGLNYASAESDASDLQRIYVFNQVAYMMKKSSAEPWYNSGQGNPPFDRFEGSQINVGLGAIHSVANDDDAIYFYGDDDQVYLMRGGASAAVTAISTLPMAEEFKTYSTTSDAIGYCINMDGQWQYHLTFPTQGKTWVYPIGGEWFELSSGVAGGRCIANSYAYCFRKHLVADYQNGNIYELDPNTYSENGNPIVRQRDTAPIHGGLFQAPGKTLTMTRFELIMETGTGILSGQGSDPVIMLSFSDDGGRTFSSEMWGQVGMMGEFRRKVEWFGLGSFDSRIMRIKISDPVRCVIYSGASDIEIGI